MNLRRPTIIAMMAASSPLIGACVSTTLDVPENHPASARYAVAPVPSISAFAGPKAAPAPRAPAEDHSHHHHHGEEGASQGAAPAHDHGGKP